MKILVTGAAGMLGVEICKAAVSKHGKNNVAGLTREHLDITREADIRAALDKHSPDIIINAAGIVKARQRPDRDFWATNARAPALLSRQADLRRIKVVQISTDCVFDGRHGPYDEKWMPDAEDIYGKSKSFGEMNHMPHLTIRTSFVGLGKRGFLCWLMNSNGAVQGYTNSLWNGLATIEAARQIVTLAERVKGLVVHLHGQDMSKYDLICACNETFELGLKVEPVGGPVIDRRLRSLQIQPVETPIREQLMELKRYV